MKKILFAAVAALAFVGCAQNEEIEKLGDKAEIKVGTVVRNSTRAAVTDNSNFNAFTVKGYTVSAATIASTGVGDSYMSADYTGGQGKWTTTSGTFYWPLKEEMHFFAYPTTVPVMVYDDTKAGFPTLSFKVEDTADKQQDLVVAYATISDKPADNKLTLNFKHILTRINFSYKLDKVGYACEVSKIVINNVSGGTATYTFNNANAPWGVGDAADVSYEYPIGTNAIIDDYYPLEDKDGSLVLLPQNVAGKTISITYTTKSTDGKHTYYTGTKTVTLPADAVWEAGKNIRYKLTLPLGAEEIKVDTSVEDLNETSNEGTAA